MKAFVPALLILSTLVSAQTTDTKTQRLDRLEAGMQAEEGIRAVKRLQYSYSQFLEWGLWPDLADLFTHSATLEIKDRKVTGKAGIEAYFKEQAGRTELGLAEGQLNTHLPLQPIITLGADGKTAKGAWHEVALLGKFGTSATWTGGIYENEYALENGTWKISRLAFYEQYTGEYETFGHKAPPKWNIPYHFEAAHVGVTIPSAALKPVASKLATNVRLAQLAQRAQQMKDETEVRNLQHSLGYYLDRKLYDDVADLFAREGSMDYGKGGPSVGRERIRRSLETLFGPTPLKTGELFDHLNLGTVVTVAGDGRTASARGTELGMIGLNGQYGRWELGLYENEFVKEDGIWKTKALHYYPRMVTDYEKGWGKDAKPSMSSYESYPKVHNVAFHYTNPVTGKAVRYPAGLVTKVTVVKADRPAPAVVTDRNYDVTLAEVERRLEQAIGVDAVENLNSSYGYYLDESAWDSMADTFAVKDGAKEISGAGVYVGQERIRKILNLRGPKGGRGATNFTIHQLTQPVIHVAEDAQTAKGRFRLFQSGGAASGNSGSWIGGLYENTAVKENGEWKFGVQDLHHTFNAPYRTGWGKMPGPSRVGSAVAGPGLVTQMAPDHPIRSRQYAFPEIDEPAFHYKNPVSSRLPAQLLP